MFEIPFIRIDYYMIMICAWGTINIYDEIFLDFLRVLAFLQTAWNSISIYKFIRDPFYLA